MSDEGSEMSTGDPFDAVDPQLTVFALANGMDRTTAAASRRFEWFAEGLERGILIEVEPGGAFRIDVLSWATGSEDATSRVTFGEGIGPADLVASLSAAIDAANGLSSGAD